MRRKSDFKKLDITLSPECFPKSYFDIVAAAFLKLSAEKSPRPEIYRMENCLNTSLECIFSYGFSHFLKQVV